MNYVVMYFRPSANVIDIRGFTDLEILAEWMQKQAEVEAHTAILGIYKREEGYLEKLEKDYAKAAEYWLE